MHALKQMTIAVLTGVVLWLPQQASAQAEIVTYKGMCDASAAVALDEGRFIVANDERNTLRIYKRNQPDAESLIDLSTFLGTKPTKESDLEGAAKIGNRIYWISSHGRNSKGEPQERRHRFFATDITPGAQPSVTTTGKPYADLLDDLLGADQLKPFKLADAAALAPEAAGGFNIEGLAATADGKLLIGFRNPIRNSRALLVPLDNPHELIEGRRAKFGTPIALDLQENGIRSIERVGSDYLLIGGPPGDNGTFGLHRWSGKPGEAAAQVRNVDFKDSRPEALFAVGTDRLQVLSDDGGAKIEGKDCKEHDETKQSFRSITIRP